MINKEEILKKAKELVTGDRNEAEDVALMMVLLKISRHTQGTKNNLDNFIDMCGYAAIAGEINESGSI